MDNHEDYAAGVACVIWLAFGLFLLPLLCIDTLVRNGIEDTPLWMTLVAFVTLVGGGVFVAALFLQGLLGAHPLPH